MTDPDLAQLITEHQQKIYGYIYSLIGNSASSWDILQEANLVLWRKQSDFTIGTNFQAWAFSIARFQVLAFTRDRKRDPLDIITPELVEIFAEDMETEAETDTPRLEALQHCRGKLSPKHSKLIDLYYVKQTPLKAVAPTLKISQNAVKQMLLRTRRNLQNCIELRLSNKAT